MELIDKSAVVAEIDELDALNIFSDTTDKYNEDYKCGYEDSLESVRKFINTLEVKEIGFDLGDPNGDKSSEYIVDTKTLEVKEDVISNDPLANSLEISRYGNPRNGNNSDLEEAAKNHKSAIHIVSPQWISEVEKAFKTGAQWQKEKLLDKACEWLEEHLLYFWSQRITNTDYFIEEFKQAMNK